MPEYRLEEAAEADLHEIGRYTVGQWGLDQAVRYLDEFDRHFRDVAARRVSERVVFEHREEFCYSKCQHHYVFFTREGNGDVLVLAFLHEAMDLIARLHDRLHDRLSDIGHENE